MDKDGREVRIECGQYVLCTCVKLLKNNFNSLKNPKGLRKKSIDICNSL